MAKGHLRRRGKDSWRLYIPTGERYPSGAPKYYTETVHGTKARAEARLTELLSQLHAGGWQPLSVTTTLGDYLRQWLAEHVERNPDLSPKTRRWYGYIVKCHLIPRLGSLQLRQLTPGHLRQYYNTARAAGRSRKTKAAPAGLSPASVYGHHRALHAALQQAVRDGVLARNVADAAAPPTPRPREYRTLTIKEIGRCLAACRGQNDLLYLYILLGVTTGMRTGEILGLRWEDIDWERKLVSVRHTLQEETRQLGRTKTPASRAQIPLPDVVAEELKRWRQIQIREKLQAGPAYQDEGFIMAGFLGKIPRARTVHRWFKDLLRELGLPAEQIRPHDLRHTFASRLLEEGVDLETVSRLLRHSSIHITDTIYAHLAPEHLRRGQAKLAGRIEEQLRAGKGRR